MTLLDKQNRTLQTLRAKVNFTEERKVASIPMNAQTNGRITGSQTDQHGKILRIVDCQRKPKAKPRTTLHDQPKGSSPMNDNYCVKVLRTGLLPGSKLLTSRKTINSKTLVNSHVVSLVRTTARAFPKERFKSRCGSLLSRLQIKICERCFLCHTIVLCKTCNKCPTCCPKSTCRGQTSKLLANLAGSGCRSESSSNPERGLHPPLSDPAKPDKISYNHKLLCQSPEEPLPVGGITSAYGHKTQ